MIPAPQFMTRKDAKEHLEGLKGQDELPLSHERDGEVVERTAVPRILFKDLAAVPLSLFRAVGV